MGKKTNTVCTVGILQIEKDSDLALGAPQKDIAKYEKIVSAFGNVVPATVVGGGGTYRLIDGHARIEAYARAGIGDIPAIVTQTDGEADKIKLSLLLSASREQGSALSEGAMIERLVMEHGQTLQGLSNFTGRSKAWLSRRQSMSRNLSPSLAGMVLAGTVCARTAEEIARRPIGEQAEFAANVAREGMNKNEVCRLVRMYRSPDATLEICRAIIMSPAGVLPACPKSGRGRKARAKGAGDGRLCGAARFASGILEGIGRMLIGHG